MARNPRCIPRRSLVEVTCRTIGGIFLLRPSEEVNEIIRGILARYARVHEMKVVFWVCASNHFHGLLFIRDLEQLALFMRDIDREIATEVRLGRIASQLLRPVNYPLAKLVASLGQSTFRLVFFTLPIAVVLGWLFHVPLPPTWGAVVGVSISVVLALLVMGGVNFLVALAAFPLKHIEGLIWTKHGAVQILSGLLVPLHFFPPGLSVVLHALPFAAISQTPTLIYLGKTQGGDVLTMLGVQVMWAAVLWGLAAWLWGLAIRRLTVQGG